MSVQAATRADVLTTATVARPPTSEQFRIIGTYAARVRSFAGDVGRAYAYDIPSGVGNPCDADFHRDVVRIMLGTVPRGHVARLGRRFALCADLLASVELPDPSLEIAWVTLLEHLTGFAAAVDETFGPGPGADEDPSIEDLDPVAPSIVRYDLIARLVRPAAVNELRDRAGAVEAFCRQWIDAPLTKDQVAIVRRLAAGQKVPDVATELGYSQRALFREMRRIWESLGVSCRSEGLVKASLLGLIDER